MKNVKDKIIITAAVGFTAASTVTSMNLTPVFAKDTTNTSVVKEDVDAKKTKKEKLEDSVKTAKSNLDDVKKVTEEKKADSDAAKKELDAAIAAQDQQSGVVQEQYESVYGAKDQDYQNLLKLMSNLETEISNKQAALDTYTKNEEDAAKNLEQAKKDLVDKQAKLDEVNDKLSKLDKNTIDTDLETAKKEQESAKTAYDTAKAASDAATSKLKDANSDLESKKALYDAANSAYNAANLEVTKKQNAVNEAQKNVDSFTGSDALTNAQNELNQANAELIDAQNAAANAQTALDHATKELSDAQSAQTTAQSNYNQSVNDFESASVALEIATKKQSDAQKAYDEADTNAKKNQSVIDDLNTQKVQCEADVSAAQTALTNAENAYKLNKSEKEVAQENLNTFIHDNQTTIDQINKGTQGFFEYVSKDLGQLTAKVFDKNNTTYGKIAQYVQLGQEGDATTLENMEAVIPWLKKNNELRAKHGLQALNVSLWEMALAQANSDWAQTHIAHSGVRDSGENLSWGYADPFIGWYDEEKAIYDTYDASLKKLSAYELSKKYPKEYSAVGHYLNIIHPNYTSFGMGHSSKGKYGFNDSQDFLFRKLDSRDVTMTVDEFEAKVNEYKTKIDAVNKEYKAKQEAVKNASDNKDYSAVEKAQKALDDAKLKLQGIKDQLVAPTSKQQELDSKVTSTKASLDLANTNVVSKQAAKSNAETLKNQNLAALELAKSNVEAKEIDLDTALSNKNSADQNVQSKLAKVKSLKDKITNWNTSKADAEKQLSDAKTALALSQMKLTNVSNTLKPARDAYDASVRAKDNAKAASDSANTALESAASLLAQKDLALKNANMALSAYNDALKAVEDANNALDSQAKLVNTYTSEQENAKSLIQKTSDEINELLENKKTLNKNIDYQKNVLAVINEVKEKGSKADVSSITDEELLGYLNELAQEVDELSALHTQYANANVKYVRLLSVYEEAKKDEAQAQKVYDEAMKDLDTYIQENSKHAAKTETSSSSTTKKNAVTTSSTNTGVKTSIGLNMAMMGVAALGMVEAKRRSKK
ncbi:hypothetical protein KSW27_08905 [Holdemanella biformis]|uniref:CAP domain-containing protein n=1 Tax=Holdemanella biformis TaxID=1735 RepID=UPI001C274E6C|nr:CAP domain-containing protein [Holdemanella biformis]MBU9896246.1 hypothetical protein [Holdemanella biformis]MBV3417390.1 hypothetical protein [Holdemanella biformis]